MHRRSTADRVGALGSVVTVVAALAALLLFAPCAYAETTDTIHLAGTDYYDMAHQVLDLTNAERAKVGRPALQMDPELTETAMQRAAETAVFFDHTRPNGTSCFSIFPTYMRSAAGENIAAGSHTAAGTVDQWVHSSGHYSNMIDPDFESIGIGCFSQGGLFFWVQCFSGTPATGSVSGAAVPRTHTVEISYNVCAKEISFNLNVNHKYKMSELKTGKTFKMKVDIQNAGWPAVYCTVEPSDVKWTSSNKKVCTVDASGVVKGMSAGTSTVKATFPSGKSVSYKWKVTGKTVQTITKMTASKTLKAARLKTAAQSFKITAKAKTNITYKVKSYVNSAAKKYKSYISVASNGKVTIKKGLPKGTYKFKVAATAKASAKYKAASLAKIITLMVK